MGRVRSAVFAARGGVASAALVLWLSACGGGGDSEAPPTELPQALSVAAPSTQQAMGTAVAFSSNATDPGHKLTYRWEFGDGSTATTDSPSHSYAKAGVYTVTLTLTNEAGSTRTSTSAVAVADMAIVQGQVCSAANQSGWCWQRPLPQGNAIADYAFVDDSHGWAVGDAGTILATTDGGVTWKAQVSGTRLNLLKATFVNTQVGWVASTNGLLLKTSDGGATWQQVSLGRNEGTQTLGASDALTAWVNNGYGSSTYITRDGGVSWTAIAVPSGLSSIVQATASDTWGATYGNYYGDPPKLSHSTNGGAWVDVPLPVVEAGVSRSINSIQFIDATHGIVTANEYSYGPTYINRTVAWRTADGGASWQTVTQPQSVPYYYYGYGLRLIDANTVFSFDYFGGLQLTQNDGSSWQPVSLPAFGNGAYFSSYQALSAQRIVVRDSLGSAYLTVDGGAHWSGRSAGGGSMATLNSVWFFDAREGLAIGADGSSVRTSDGGQAWTTTTPSAFYGWRRAQFLADGSVGWVVSDTGAIYRSTDKGKTWLSPVPQSSVPLYGITDFHFVDAQHGWALSYANTVYASSDGGMSWQAVNTTMPYGYQSLRFADATHGVVVGVPGIALVTSDGGVTWNPVPTGLSQGLRRVTFADANTAVAVGESGVIVRSTDQGRSWTVINSPATNTLNDVRFRSARFGYAVGDYGTWLVTRDGGLTWNRQSTGATASLQAAFFTDEQTGWVVGSNGSILATATGGR
jgi:photosystem II stability/assembly factor-like uncharacterized protein